MIQYEDDTHFCLKCHATILGLENYVAHRKEDCPKNIQEPGPLQGSENLGLKADDFFSSLELRSSSKKPEQTSSGKNFSGILTRSKISAVIQGTKDPQETQQSKSGKNVWIGGNQLKDLGTGDNQSKLIKAVADLERRKEGAAAHSPPRIVYEDSDEDSEEYEYDEDESSEEDYAPPRNYTGGKWKPSSPVQWSNRDWNVPPPNYTGGKWKPKKPPSPSYTKGKWKPQDDEPTGGKFPPPVLTKGKWKPSDYEISGGKHPPPGHTKGKWKPPDDDSGGKYPPQSHTRGKWKPIDDEPCSSSGGKHPPPGHTKGKWKPLDEEVYPSHGGKHPPPIHTRGKWKPLEDSFNPTTGGKYPPPGLTRGKWKPVDEDPHSFSGGKHPRSKLKLAEDDAVSSTSNGGKCPPVGHTRGKWKPGEEEGQGKGKMRTSTKNEDENTASNYVKETDIPKVHYSLNPDETLDQTAKATAKVKTDSLAYSQPGPSGDLCPDIESQYKITADSSLRNSGAIGQYWCGSCNRRLSSKIVFERHLKSELHFKRSRHEGEFDDGAGIKRIKLEPQQSSTITANHEKPKQERKRNRRKTYETCAACKSKVNRYLMGKHLISHYHCRKGGITSKESTKLVLENILSIVLESPFQCNLCKFYCNTTEQFLKHWTSDFHLQNDRKHPGYFFCAFCKVRTDTSGDMLTHLTSFGHLEVVSVINRSVPITIKKISEIYCITCAKAFTLNIQLSKHCQKTGHDSSNVSMYDTKDYECKTCSRTFSKALSLQRHLRKKHQHEYFFCGPCRMKFETSAEASAHRRSMQHRYTILKTKSRNPKRKCEHCQEEFPNFLLLKDHLKERHPEHKVRCPYCGTSFTIPQELTNHIKNKSCKFPQNETTDDPENLYQCLQCSFSSDSTAELLFHVALHEEPLIEPTDRKDRNAKSSKPSPKYKCPLCDKFFPKHSLQPHLRIHTEERPYVCKTCKASFARKNNLLYHEKNHEVKRKNARKECKNGKSFLCSTCGSGFNRKFTLQQHMLTHGGKLCRCPEVGCFFIARKMSELQEHFVTHSSQKNFGCDLCGYKGKTKKQLKRHQTVHEGVKKYSCSVCQLTCRTAAHLRRHVRLHTGAKPFKCPYCRYKCNNMENLRRHVLSTSKHPGKSIYECKKCKKFQTNVAKQFKNHLMLLHNEEFGNSKDAATYIAGIYEAQEDSSYMIDAEGLDDPPEDSETLSIRKLDPAGNARTTKLKTDEDPVVAQLEASSELSTKDRTLDQMLPMFIISKDDSVNVEVASDSWSLIGRYDVEESGTLVPFHSEEDDELFQEHF